MDKIRLLPAAEPFYYPGNDIGCLMVHGVTGTPFELHWLGEHLNKQGYTVFGPRLAGHATELDALKGIRWQEWYADVLAGYMMLRRQCRVVIPVGLSMGGALVLLLASQEQVGGVVALSAPYEINDPRLKLLPLAPLLDRFMTEKAQDDADLRFEERVKSEQERRGEKPTGHPNYDKWSVPAIRELLKMLEHVREGLPTISAPSLLIHSKRDRTVPFRNLDLTYNAIGSADKQKLILEESGHCVAEDMEAGEVFAATSAFIAKHTA